ncbi:YceD family protein [Paragemmobacter straminiformis]|uniref:DUF177 domain-containing protein n=1 Tax=Paragemmobacter straminiformis TaxID=2045119 RepID=A0A842I855_9RHOB|nr:YceD family protein [Gemmobacter straminiformis]MBC2835583.1 DUF177 domain-containing protein [Gemmobacter straminiformis]
MSDALPHGADAKADLPLSHPLRVANLPNRKPVHFDLKPDAATRAAMAEALEITALPAFRFKGELRAAGKRDFVLQAQMEATVEQPCSVTLAPVVTPLQEAVARRYDADFAFPDGEEAEMPEDDTTEPLPEVIDLGAVALEALALALPLYPRAPGVELGEAVFTAPGQAPLRDGDLKPFAGLAALKDRLGGGETPE